jgi:ferredoxin-NADP reductase
MWRVGTVVALQDETATARTITLKVPDWPGHIAGQHVDVRLTASDGYSAVRSYSIASAPNAEKRVELTVERLPNGEVSPYLTQELAVGDRLELRGPIGGWFVWRPQQTEPIQLIAGGSGIVPLMAMIRSRASTGSTAPFRLLYSVREPAAVFYRDDLLALSDCYNKVSLTYAYTRIPPKDWPRPPGREGRSTHRGAHGCRRGRASTETRRTPHRQEACRAGCRATRGRRRRSSRSCAPHRASSR